MSDIPLSQETVATQDSELTPNSLLLSSQIPDANEDLFSQFINYDSPLKTSLLDDPAAFADALASTDSQPFDLSGLDVDVQALFSEDVLNMSTQVPLFTPEFLSAIGLQQNPVSEDPASLTFTGDPSQSLPDANLFQDLFGGGCVI
jgi:hypothetical protein